MMSIIEQGKKTNRNSLLERISQKPIIASIIIMFVAIGFTFIPLESVLQKACSEQAAVYWSAIIEQVIVSIILVIVLKKIDLFEKVGFTVKVKELWIIWPMLLFCLLSVVDYIDGKIDWSRPGIIILFALSYMSTGLFEEILCRGMVFNLMMEKWGKTKKGAYWAVLLSSLLFGSFHFVHFILGHSDLIATLTQVIYATFFGVFFCGCYVRNKSIYPVIILHGLVDITGDLKEIAIGGGINKSYIVMTISQALTITAIVLPFLIYGLWIVRKEFAKIDGVENNKYKQIGGDND